ncbi:MAG: hypothetical protein KDC38_16370, partial [Planctomycetes bacterium]|nr:hypothetical protein [Planctomycetota bacterium]
LKRLVSFGEFTKAGETDQTVEFRLTPDAGGNFERHLNKVYTTVKIEIDGTVGPTLLDASAVGGWQAQKLEWDFADHPTVRFEFTGTQAPHPLTWPEPDLHPNKWKSWLAFPRFLYAYATDPIGSHRDGELDQTVVVQQDSSLKPAGATTEADYSIRYEFDFTKKLLPAQPVITRRLLDEMGTKSENPRPR